MDVVDRIASVATGSRATFEEDTPLEPVVITTARIVGEAATPQVNAARRKTLLISDLHLDPSAPGIARQFVEFLRGEAREARALYILGDLFEAWLGDDDPDPAVRSIVAELRALHDAGVPTFFMHGNRDFLIGSRFAAETGCTLLDDGTVVDLHGERVLLMHGDVLCTADTSYQRLRRILRNPLTLFVLRHLGLETRRKLGRKLRAGSQMHVGSTAPRSWT